MRELVLLRASGLPPSVMSWSWKRSTQRTHRLFGPFIPLLHFLFVLLCRRNIPLWATSIVTNALDVVDSTASALGVGSQVKNITNEIRNQTNRVNYNLMKQYAMQVPCCVCFSRDFFTFHLFCVSMQTIVQFEDRQSMYVQSGDSLTHSIIEHSNRVGDALGVTYPVTISAPLATALVQSSFIRLFLDQVSESTCATVYTADSHVCACRSLVRSCSCWC